MEKCQHAIIERVASIGSHLTCRCGINTFAADLCEVLADEYKHSLHRAAGQ